MNHQTLPIDIELVALGLSAKDRVVVNDQSADILIALPL